MTTWNNHIRLKIPPSHYQDKTSVMEKAREKTSKELVEEIKSSQRGSVEVPEDFVDLFLGAVPPPAVQNDNGFICGEPYSADKHFTFFYKRGQSGSIESYQAELLPIKTAKAMLEGKIIDKDGFRFIEIDQHKGWSIMIAEEERKYSKASLWLQDPQSKDISLAQELTTYDKRSNVYKIINATVESRKSGHGMIIDNVSEPKTIGRFVDGDPDELYIETLYQKHDGSFYLEKTRGQEDVISASINKEAACDWVFDYALDSQYEDFLVEIFGVELVKAATERTIGVDQQETKTLKKTFGEWLGSAPVWDFDNALASKIVNGVEYRITDENIFIDGKKKYPLYKDKERVDLFDGVSLAKEYVEKSNKHILSIDGEQVWASCSKAGSENNDELSRHEEQIKSNSYTKIKIPLADLLNNDKDLGDFVEKSRVTGMVKRPITQPIIIGNVSRGYPIKNDCVLDGFNRVLQALINNDKEIEAYAPTHSKYLDNVRATKMGQDQKVIVGVNDNAHTDVNDERIYNSKWRGYR